MTFRFERRQRQRRRQRALQIALGVCALLAAIAVVTAWIATQFFRGQDDTPADTSQPMIQRPQFTPADTFYLLTMLTDRGAERFTLITASPADGAVLATAVPGDRDLGGGRTPAAVYRKSGAAAVTALIAETQQIPLRHYVAFSGSGAEDWFNYLEKGIAVTLPQAVNFTDTDGVILRLAAGEHNLTATQAVKLMRYSGWEDADGAARMAAAVTAAAINQYFRVPDALGAQFAQLSNVAGTDLRIGDFTAAREKLDYLARRNDGRICQTAMISG